MRRADEDLDVRDAHDVGKHAGCGDRCTRTIALDEHGILVVALGGDEDDVVGAFEVVERMKPAHLTYVIRGAVNISATNNQNIAMALTYAESYKVEVQ